MSLNWSEASKGINFRILWDTTSWNSQRALRWQGIYSLFVALLSEFYLVISYYILLATISPIHQCCSARGNFLQRLYWFLVLISVRLDLSLRICYHTTFRSCAYILSFPTKWYTHPWDLVSSPSSLLGSRGTKRREMRWLSSGRRTSNRRTKNNIRFAFQKKTGIFTLFVFVHVILFRRKKRWNLAEASM